MRLKITLEPTQGDYTLPLNYMYPLSAVVYKIFASGSESVAKWLHQKGFSDKTGKNLKLFNFSNLIFEKYRINAASISCAGHCSFIFSFPIQADLTDTFIKGVFNLQSLYIGNSLYQSEFRIKAIEIEKAPQFSNSHVFYTLSPISVSTVISIIEKRQIYYYRPEDIGFINAIKQNLIKKYELVYKKSFAGSIEVSIPEGTKSKSKLIAIKEGTAEETKIKAFFTSIAIKGDSDILTTAYYCGLGEKNSLGFGMMKIDNNNH